MTAGKWTNRKPDIEDNSWLNFVCLEPTLMELQGIMVISKFFRQEGPEMRPARRRFDLLAGCCRPARSGHCT